jgi:NAD kinase
MAAFEKIVVITQRTALQELIERFNTREQARFYVEHMGASFTEYEAAHDTYEAALRALRVALPTGMRSQVVERGFLPTFTFGEHDLVLTLGPDGLVVNAAKYLAGQPLLAFNPDPTRIDGILAPFAVPQAPPLIQRALRAELPLKRVSMAQATLNDGQVLYAVNDLFIGQRTHVSARYELRWGKAAERQSSSGIIVSTGAGSTGWRRSILTGASRPVEAYSRDAAVRQVREQYRFDWEADYLEFSVREPFVSRVSSAEIACGRIHGGEPLLITSQMPQNGVIFSDGIESDYLEFNTGAIAEVGLAARKLHLVVPS